MHAGSTPPVRGRAGPTTLSPIARQWCGRIRCREPSARNPVPRLWPPRSEQVAPTGRGSPCVGCCRDTPLGVRADPETRPTPPPSLLLPSWRPVPLTVHCWSVPLDELVTDPARQCVSPKTVSGAATRNVPMMRVARQVVPIQARYASMSLHTMERPRNSLMTCARYRAPDEQLCARTLIVARAFPRGHREGSVVLGAALCETMSRTRVWARRCLRHHLTRVPERHGHGVAAARGK
jgi:hypothetical protein